MNFYKVINKKPFLNGILCLLLVWLATMPLYMRPYLVILLSSVLMYVVITLSWSIFSGPTRYISLASAAFYGVGVYGSAILGEILPLPAVIFSGGLISFFLALFIGLLTLRLKGMYFIIFTFGISELIRHSLLWYETNFMGTVDYVMLVILVMVLLCAYLIRRSKYGLALRSIGENEEASVHMGIDVTILKTVTFAVSAFFMGATGGIMATRWTYIDPKIAFDPLFSFMPVLMAIFGGVGQLYGPLLGATILALLEELLTTKFPYYYMLLFGSILIIVILFLPGGLAGIIEKWRKADNRR
jgi:branched-chain amino acid transport system permease protein